MLDGGYEVEVEVEDETGSKLDRTPRDRPFMVSACATLLVSSTSGNPTSSHMNNLRCMLRDSLTAVPRHENINMQRISMKFDAQGNHER